MGILWGGWGSGNNVQAGSQMTMSPSVVGPTTTTVTITEDIYIRLRYAGNENGSNITPWSVTGGFTPSSGYGNGFSLGAMGYKKIGTTVRYVATSATAGVYVGSTATVTSTYAYPGQSAVVANSISVPARPATAPAAPTSFTAVRVSDTQASMSWVNHPGGSAPVSSNTIYQRTYYGGWSAWAVAATVSGTATLFSRTGLGTNRAYQFYIKANNSAGSSGNVFSGVVYMAPTPPTGVTSRISASGTAITTSWASLIYGGGYTPVETFEVQRSSGGGAWVSMVTGITARSWTDPSPAGGINQYRVRTFPAGDPTSWSDMAYGNVVSTIVPPLAPIGLTPNGAAVDLTKVLTLTWTHNPGPDYADQSAFTIQTSNNGGTTWVTRANAVASTVSSWVLPAGTLTNGTTYQWRVQTQGSSGAAYGPYSAVATLIGSATPVVTITVPGAAITALPLVVTRTYTQAGGSPQAQTTTELYDSTGNQLLETITTTGTGLSHTFTYRVQDGTSYQIRVRSQSAVGLWSAWVTKTVPVTLPPPAAATVTGVFQPCDGTVVLSLAGLARVGTDVAIDHLILERRINGVGDWVALTDNFVPPGDFLDLLPPLNGFVEYRVTSVSLTPSYRLNPVVTVDTAVGGELWVFLSFGLGFTKIVRVRGNPKIGEVTGRERAVTPMAGRARPVLQVGANTTRVVSFSGALYYDADCGDDVDLCRFDSPPTGWRTASQEADVVAYRDYHGRRLFGMLSDVSVEEGETLGVGTVSFSVTEDDTVVGYAATAAP